MMKRFIECWSLAWSLEVDRKESHQGWMPPPPPPSRKRMLKVSAVGSSERINEVGEGEAAGSSGIIRLDLP